MSIVSVDDLVSRPITVMNTIQEAVHVETRLDYSQALRWAVSSILLLPALLRTYNRGMSQGGEWDGG